MLAISKSFQVFEIFRSYDNSTTWKLLLYHVPLNTFVRALATLRLDPTRIQLISGFIDTYLKLNTAEEELFRTNINQIAPEEQEVVMQIVTSWMEQGL